MNPKPKTEKLRADALTQLKEAQQMLQDGKSQLVIAQQQIERAQQLIDQSAEVLRATSGRSAPSDASLQPERPPVRRPR